LFLRFIHKLLMFFKSAALFLSRNFTLSVDNVWGLVWNGSAISHQSSFLWNRLLFDDVLLCGECWKGWIFTSRWG
jgi:hypothetical protein